MELLGQRADDLTHAVNAIANPHLVLVRLNVDVARAQPDRVSDDLVHQAGDDGVSPDLVAFVLGTHSDRLLQVADHVADVGLRSAELVDRGNQVTLGGHCRPNLLAGHDANVVNREDVGGIGHRDHQRVSLDADRQNNVAAHQLGLEQDRGTRVYIEGADVYER